jgi:DNA-binding beta-propeller fold protein YncE
MQFPVPQFTDVEDKIIGALSFKQFGIVFAAAIITFVVYTVSKSVIATIFVGVLTGLPALALTFGKLNGRPLYSSAGNFVRFLFGAKIYVFHKQAQTVSEQRIPVTVKEEKAPKDKLATAVKIKELNYILQQQASEENTLIARIHENSLLKSK